MSAISLILSGVGVVWLCVELDGCLWKTLAISCLIGVGAMLHACNGGGSNADNN